MSDVVTEQPSGRALPGRWSTGLINGPCCIGKPREFKYYRENESVLTFITIFKSFFRP